LHLSKIKDVKSVLYIKQVKGLGFRVKSVLYIKHVKRHSNRCPVMFFTRPIVSNKTRAVVSNKHKTRAVVSNKTRAIASNKQGQSINCHFVLNCLSRARVYRVA